MIAAYFNFRVFKVKTNRVFFFRISFFHFRDIHVLYYANEESDDDKNKKTKVINTLGSITEKNNPDSAGVE